MEIKYDGCYISEEQEDVRYHIDRRILEPYYLFYSFFPDGTWICKTADTKDFPFLPWLQALDVETIRRNPEKDEPMMPNKELLYQSGNWRMEDDTVHIEWKNSHVGNEPMYWFFRMKNEEELETRGGEFTLIFKKF